MVGQSELNHIRYYQSVLKLYSSLSLDIQEKIAYTGRFIVNLPYVGTTFLRLNYVDITKNTYI